MVVKQYSACLGSTLQETEKVAQVWHCRQCIPYLVSVSMNQLCRSVTKSSIRFSKCQLAVHDNCLCFGSREDERPTLYPPNSSEE